MTPSKHWHWLMSFPRYRESEADHASVLDCVFDDRGYDAETIRQGLRGRHIIPFLAKRNTQHGSGLGRWRWVVERTFAWLNQFRRLRVRYEKRADIHEAFLSLGCTLICWRFLQVN
jgi:transposase